jgi:hypothetical protein
MKMHQRVCKANKTIYQPYPLLDRFFLQLESYATTGVFASNIHASRSMHCLYQMTKLGDLSNGSNGL